MKYLLCLLSALGIFATANATNMPEYQNINPEAFTGIYENHQVTTSRYMAVSANEFATQAGASLLAEGASAIDAAIAMQMVLNLVEPQSSGIGGGGFMLYYDAKTGAVHAWDGRETAPATAQPDRFIQNGKPMHFFEAVNSGLSVGTPGLLHMLHQAHQYGGKLKWDSLFSHAIHLAETGFPVSERLHQLIAQNQALKDNPHAAAYFYDVQGQPLEVGHMLKNKSLANVFKQIARHGPSAFYQGKLAQDMVSAVTTNKLIAGDLSLEDLASYSSEQRSSLCVAYRAYEVCGMPPPSSGPLAIMQMLGILEHTPIHELKPGSLLAVHYFSEAGRLAYADRDHYIADPNFVYVPAQPLLDKNYLKTRAQLIAPYKSMGVAQAGTPPNIKTGNGHDGTREYGATTHMVVADEYGNVVSMTSSIESAFGSKIFVNGYLLNNELTDFSFDHADAHGNPIANRVEPLKRPRSSMAPLIILKDGKPFMAIGSPGGSAIINYVAKTVVGVLDWGLSLQEAINLPNMGSRNSYTELERGTSITGLAPGLEHMGHEVRELDFPSGLHGLVITAEGITSGVDIRREGRAMGK